MESFKDPTGRQWDLSINALVADRLLSRLGVDVRSFIENGSKTLGELCNNPLLMTKCVAVMCQEQITKQGMSEDDFLRMFDGEMMLSASKAFLAEIPRFFESPVRQNLSLFLTKILASSQKVSIQKNKQAREVLESLDFDSLAETSFASSGNAPASAVSTPALSQ